MAATTDQAVIDRIQQLVKEEQDLYHRGDLHNREQVRLDDIRVQLDQCWDLLRQRRALREFGKNPNAAKVRPPEVVEDYEQ